MTNPDYADKIAERISIMANVDIERVREMLAESVREGYEIGYATAIDMNVVKRGGW